MKIVLAAVGKELADAWDGICHDCDAVVSPANSFGFMDGGIDARYSDRFGWQVQERLQKVIQTKHHGELLVGTAEIVETDHPAIPYLIAAPPMRVPMVLQDSVNPYLAARAVLLLVKHDRFESGPLAGEKILDMVQTIAFPGLATGIGQVDVKIK